MPTLEVRHEGTDITNYILDYRRDLDICTGIGTVSILVAKTYTSDIEVWDNVDVYEDGHKRGEFNVSKTEIDSESHSLKVFCQDNSKKLADYFVAEAYFINYYSTTRHWIEKFMNDAGVGYTFTVANQGVPISKNTTLGVEAAYEIVVRMLQQSGWYMYFNDSGNAVIGKFSLDYSNYKKKFTDDDILAISKVKEDKMLRNRAVVWGNANIETGEWVFADLKKTTTWNYDNKDFRTILFSNYDILNSTIAADLASQLLDEFCRITETKVVRLHGFHNVHIGDVVLIKSKYHHGVGLVTSLEVTANNSGYITTLTIDERCPRLFSYYAFDQGKVYCGTNGNGVWQKDLAGSTWSDFSTGIADLQIKDLAIANGVFACVTASGQVYTRDISDSSWSLLSYGDFLDEVDSSVTPASSVQAVACDINRATSEIYVLFYGGLKAWVGLVVNQTLVGTKQVYINLNGTRYANLFVFDVGTDDNKVFVTIGSGALPYPIFQNSPFPVIEAFTHNDQNEVDGFGILDYTDFNGTPSNCVWDYGSVHWSQVNINKVTHVDLGEQIKFYSHSFSGATVIDTISPWITLSGYSFGGSRIHKAVGSNIIYVLDGNNSNIFTHTIGASTIQYHSTVSFSPYGGTWDDIYNGVLYKSYIQTVGSNREYKLDWFDITNSTSGTITYGIHELHDNVWDGDADDTEGKWSSFGMLGLLRWYVGKNNNNPNDNFVVGCCSYDEQYFAYAYIIGVIFNTVSKNVITFKKQIHPEPGMEESDSVCTSHCAPGDGDEYRRVAPRWMYLDYNEGIPYVRVQFNMLDRGPWVWNPGLGYYEYLGYREGYSVDPPEYPRVIWYNPLTDAFNKREDDTYNPTYYNDSSFQEYLGRITLTSSQRYFTTQNTAGVASAGGGWRDKDFDSAANTDMETWNFYDRKDKDQEKLDYFYYQYPVVSRYQATSNRFYYMFRTYDLNAASGYGKNIYLTQIPYDDDEGFGGWNGQHEQRASQNVFAIKMGYIYWRDRFNKYSYDYSWTWQFYRFGSWSDFLSRFYATTVNVVSGFQLIDITQLPQYLEVGSSGPIITYAKAISGYAGVGTVPSGLVRIGLVASGMYLPSSYSLGSVFPSGFVPNYSFTTPPGNYTVVFDARPIRLNPTTPFPLSSGYLTTSGVTVVGLAMDNRIIVRPINDLVSQSGWQTVVTYPEELVTNLETTHFFSSPYIFNARVSSYNLAGYAVTASGISKFSQRNPGGSTWYQYNPPVSSYITCIRVDSRV